MLCKKDELHLTKGSTALAYKIDPDTIKIQIVVLYLYIFVKIFKYIPNVFVFIQKLVNAAEETVKTYKFEQSIKVSVLTYFKISFKISF